MTSTDVDPLEDRPLVSVIISFKDWGHERLELSIGSIHGSLGEIPHEVIIADYGSADAESITAVAARAGARHERIATDGEWSASRAQNAGMRAARGDILMASDADMLFTPGALSRTVDQLRRHPQEVVILQCRDLPVGYSHEIVRRDGLDWELFAAIGQLRPRWGVGGLVALHRELWERVRGWDERMHTYGGEDTDFALRVRRCGARIDWLDEPGVAMFHIWHPSTSARAAHSPEATAAIAANRRIHREDLTFVRNRTAARYLPSGMVPIATVVLDARETEPDAVDRTLASIIEQSILSLEVLVLGESELEPSMELAGRSVRRVEDVDAALREARGTYIGVARAGDEWSSDRLERLLGATAPGIGIVSDASAMSVVVDGTPTAPALVSDGHLDVTGALIDVRLLSEAATATTKGVEELLLCAATSGTGWATVGAVGRVRSAALESDEVESRTRAFRLTALRTAVQRCGLVLPAAPDLSGTALPAPAPAGAAPLVVSHGAGVDVDPICRLDGLGAPVDEVSIRTLDGLPLRRVLTFLPQRRLDRAIAAAMARTAGATVENALGGHPAETTDVQLQLLKDLEAIHGDGRGGLWAVVGIDGGPRDDVEPGHDPVGATAVIERVIVGGGQEQALRLTRFSRSHFAAAGRHAAHQGGASTLVEISPTAEGERS